MHPPGPVRQGGNERITQKTRVSRTKALETIPGIFSCMFEKKKKNLHSQVLHKVVQHVRPVALPSPRHSTISLVESSRRPDRRNAFGTYHPFEGMSLSRPVSLSFGVLEPSKQFTWSEVPGALWNSHYCQLTREHTLTEGVDHGSGISLFLLCDLKHLPFMNPGDSTIDCSQTEI